MIRAIAMIPARGGSKSVPYKNLKELGGKPLLAWPIEAAKQSPEIARTIVSTDDDRIAAVAREHGAEVYLRPKPLATDTALVIDAIRDLWRRLKAEGETADILVLLEPTSPFRGGGVVQRCLRRLVDEKFDSIATFQEAAINPERTWRIENGAPQPFLTGAVPWKPRQKLTPAYQLNGVVYALYPDRLPADSPSLLYGKIGAEIIDARSAIDIDTERDFEIANAILRT